ncbi:MAG: hypothetical protein JNN30_13600 [Rhodanobacteraceae bacterium]|nr:hypothetical protein [Rhodanobacteraceae bacterium]
MSALTDAALICTHQERLVARRLAAVAQAGADVATRRTLFVVVREPDMQALTTGLARMVRRMSVDERSAWLANFTKVRLFAGHPARTAVAPLLNWIEADTMGFALVDAEARHPRLADLLLPLRTRSGPAAPSEQVLRWDGAGEDGDARACDAEGWELEIDISGLDWPQYLVHVLHLLAEASLEALEFSGPILLRHLASPPACDAHTLQLRMDLETSPPTCRAVLRRRVSVDH